MKKILFSLIVGILLTLNSPQVAQAQRIEQDSTGRYYACTNYDLHMRQKQKSEFKKFILYSIVLVGVAAVASANDPHHYNDPAYRQYGYALGAVAGACLVVGLYKWNVKLQNDAGL